jgi:acetyltransferase-like isoleucine patch superfamily enzyme
MKIELKDYLFSTIIILFIVFVTVFLLSLSHSRIVSYFGGFHPIIHFILFFLLYGFITAFYLNILDKIYPFQEGSYDMNHPQFTLWKHHSVVGEMGRFVFKLFFPYFFWSLFYIIWGAKLGRSATIGGILTDPLLTKVNAYAVVGKDSVLTCHTVVFNKFFIKPIIIDKGATVGIKAVIMPGVKIGENAIVAPGSVVLMDTRIPANEFWGGIPAKKIKNI